jgi:hypothetical protein
MVVLVALLPRKPGMSKEDFHRHWRERHGPLVVEALGKHLQRYESEDAFMAFLNDPAYGEKIASDEQEFMDVGRVVWFIAQPPEKFV